VVSFPCVFGLVLILVWSPWCFAPQFSQQVVSESWFVNEVLVFEFCLRGSVPMWKGLSLEGEIVRYPSVTLSSTLSRNEKVGQHIRKKTRKLNVLMFLVEGGIIFLYRFRLSSHCLRYSLCFLPHILLTILVYQNKRRHICQAKEIKWFVNLCN